MLAGGGRLDTGELARSTGLQNPEAAHIGADLPIGLLPDSSAVE